MRNDCHSIDAISMVSHLRWWWHICIFIFAMNHAVTLTARGTYLYSTNIIGVWRCRITNYVYVSLVMRMRERLICTRHVMYIENRKNNHPVVFGVIFILRALCHTYIAHNWNIASFACMLCRNFERKMYNLMERYPKIDSNRIIIIYNHIRINYWKNRDRFCCQTRNWIRSSEETIPPYKIIR